MREFFFLILIALSISILSGCGTTRVLVKNCDDYADGLKGCDLIKEIK